MASTNLLQPMSPESFAPFDGMPGCAAVALDASMRVLWCNEEFARTHGSTPDKMVGSDLSAHLPAPMLREREALIRPALEDGQTVSFAQLAQGIRWLTRVFPLDSDAFGKPGVFMVLKQGTVRRSTQSEKGAAIPLAKVGDLGDIDVLTPRELEVFYHLASGMTVAEIGELLHRSPKTVERHLESLHRKLNFRNRAELVRSAVERGVSAFTPEEWSWFVSCKRNML